MLANRNSPALLAWIVKTEIASQRCLEQNIFKLCPKMTLKADHPLSDWLITWFLLSYYKLVLYNYVYIFNNHRMERQFK